MKAVSKQRVYPILDRFFPTVLDLAHATNIGRTRASECLQGKIEFTEEEKICICNAMIAQAVIDGNYGELQMLLDARDHFDEKFRIGGNI